MAEDKSVEEMLKEEKESADKVPITAVETADDAEMESAPAENDDVVVIEQHTTNGNGTGEMEYEEDVTANLAKPNTGPAFEISRSLRVTGLPTSMSEESDESIKEVICESIATALKLSDNTWLESTAKLPLNTDGAEDSQMQAIVVFKSRIHKHRVYTQRAKLEKPVEVFQITHKDLEGWGLKADSMDNNTRRGRKGKGKKDDVDKQEAGDGDDTAKGKAAKFVIDWDGAPEFQWRIPRNDGDACKLVLENVSLGDLDSPWLYQSIQRARNVDYSATSSNFKGNFDHSVLRKGTLTLTFPTDNAAMAQAVNGMVCIRTRPNKRLKIYLPQTPSTLRMKNLLEMKLGRVHKANLKSRQLLIRGINGEVNEETIRTLLNRTDPTDIESMEFLEDAVKRRCCVVTFKSAEAAIWAHIKHDEVKAAKGNKYSRVFYMQDIQPKELLLKPELRDIGNAQKRTRSRSRSPPTPSTKRTNIGGATGGPRDNARGGASNRRGISASRRSFPAVGGRGRGGPPTGGFRAVDGRDDRYTATRGGAYAEPWQREQEPWSYQQPQPLLQSPQQYPSQFQMGAASGGSSGYFGGSPSASAGFAAPDPMLQMQQQLRKQEEQLQMQNRIMQQSDLIKGLAEELKKVRSIGVDDDKLVSGRGPAPPAQQATAAYGRPAYGEPPREQNTTMSYGRTFGGNY